MIIDIWWSPKYHILSNKCTRAESIGGQISKEGGAYFKLRIVVHMKFCIYSRTTIAILIVLLFVYFFNIHFYLVTCRLWLYFYSITHFNTYVPNAPFLYPLKTSENREVFWCFQWVEKGFIWNEWVKMWHFLEGGTYFDLNVKERGAVSRPSPY